MYQLTDVTKTYDTGRQVVTVTDTGGEETLEVHSGRVGEEARRLEGLDVGRPYALRISPTADELVLVMPNGRHETWTRAPAD